MDVRVLTIFVALALGACSGPAAQRVEEEAAPGAVDPVEAAADFPTVEVPFEKFVLDNGLTVIVHEDHKTPVVAVNVWYHVGSKDELTGKTGFAHLFEHLMFQGSENFSGEFFEPLEKAGATDMNGTTNKDRTNYFETVPTSALDLALWLESDRMGHFAGAISQELLDEQRGVVQNEKRQGLNRPYGKVWDLVPSNTYPAGHPYSWSPIGSMEDLNAANLDDVKAWFGQHYGASNAVVVIAGDITAAEGLAKAKKYFGDIPAGPATAKRGPWVAPMTERKELTIFDDVPQERVYMIFNVPEQGSKTTEELRVASWVLGSGKNSRLYRRLVYEDQLATAADIWLNDGEVGSQIYIIADARPGVGVAKVEAAITEELARFAAEGPTAEELQRVKMNYFAGLVSGLERVGGFGGKSDLLARHEIFFDDPGAYQRLQRYLREARPKDVQAAADEWLEDDAVFVLRVLPEPERSVAEAQADRSELPEAGPAPSLDLPDLQRAKLSNGIEVLLSERHDTPIVNVSALFDVGFAYDKSARLGTTKFAMDVIDEGTESLSSLELAAELERLGARLSNSVSLDHVQLTLTTLTTTLPESLDVLGGVLLRPAFASEEIDRVRKRTLAEIDQEKARPFPNALRLLGPIVYGDAHPYGQPLTGTGTTDSVTALTRDDLVAFHQAVVHPKHAAILVVGDTTMETIKPLLEERFGKWSGEAAPFEGTTAAAQKAAGVTVYLIDKPRAEQSLIVAGHTIAPYDKDTQVAIDAMNAIVGGTFMARMNMNLREDKHWSYGARSFVFESRLDQLFGSYAQVQTDKTAESMVEIHKELAQFVGTRPATPEELQRTQNNKTRRLPGQNETTGRLLSSITELVRYDLPDNYWDTFVERINGLTVEQIQTTAQQTIDPKRMTWIVIGDLSRIEQKVRDLDLGEVVVLDASGAAVK